MHGLTSYKAKELLKQYGPNVITERQKKSFFFKFIEQFNDFLTILLLSASGISFFIGEMVDAILILLIVVLNAIFGLYQEAKAEESIAALKSMTVTKVRVVRDGKEIEIDSHYLVPGDVVFIEEGTKIPADGKVIESVNLEINEASLTGESLPVVKAKNEEIFSGTIVAKGRGLLEVVNTGDNTKFGKIAAQLVSIIETKTPLQKKLEDFSRIIGIVGIIIAFFVFFISFFQGSGYFPAFLLAVSLAVALVPEGLPAVMTITLSIGVKRMADRKAIIRKLSAIEALGSVSLIATDKTGTLTTNKMKVKEVYIDDNLYSEQNLPDFSNLAFSKLVLNGVLCSTASLVYVHDHGSWDVLGDPTEGALLFLAQNIGQKPDLLRKEYPIVDERPFDSVTKRMSVVVKEDKENIIFTKGAPESILEISDKILIGKNEEILSEEKIKQIEKVFDGWAKKGLRVLAFAYKPHKSAIRNLQLENEKLIFLGMVAIHDAPRPEIKEAVTKAKQAGIKIVMITGDNEKTAEAIGVSAGLISQGDRVVTGQQLESFSDEELLQILPKVKIFARTTPFHKHKIVELYQKLGEIVAVTGDGVNDAIALKRADVGVAMGLVGTDVARETADMVITDDNFATIVNAIEEGRNIIKNLKNAVTYLISCNIGEAIALVGGLLLGFTHILFPIQLLYINLVTDGLPALSLAFSPKNANLMNQSPQKEMRLLGKKDKIYISKVALLVSVFVLGAFYIYQKQSVILAQTAAFSILAISQSFILVDMWLSRQKLRANLRQLLKPIFLTAFLTPVLLQFFILRSDFLAKIFKITTVSVTEYLFFIISCLGIFIGIKVLRKIGL